VPSMVGVIETAVADVVHKTVEARPPATASEMDKKVAAQRTLLAKAVETATKKKRVAQGEVKKAVEDEDGFNEAEAAGVASGVGRGGGHAGVGAQALQARDDRSANAPPRSLPRQPRRLAHPHQCPPVPGLADLGGLDWQRVQDSLHEVEEAGLEKLVRRSSLSDAQWQGTRSVAISQRAEDGLDMPDAGGDAGDAHLPETELGEPME
ncbi:unnamed protein product, partial [Prorocentrum cordatum]